MSGLPNQDFEILALPLLDPLYNFARWLCGDADEARDLVQETFAKALKGFASFRQGTNFRAWMFTILRNTFLTTLLMLPLLAAAPQTHVDHPGLVKLHWQQAAKASTFREMTTFEIATGLLSS